MTPDTYAEAAAALRNRDAAIVARLRAGETQAHVAVNLCLNPVTVGRIAFRNGFRYPEAQAAAAARRGKTHQHPERVFQADLIKLAELDGWRHYHTHRSDCSPAGFPDLVLVRVEAVGETARCVIAELKAAGGRPTAAQKTWLSEMEMVPGLEVYLWSPDDWESIVRVLSRSRIPRAEVAELMGDLDVLGGVGTTSGKRNDLIEMEIVTRDLAVADVAAVAVRLTDRPLEHSADSGVRDASAAPRSMLPATRALRFEDALPMSVVESLGGRLILLAVHLSPCRLIAPIAVRVGMTALAPAHTECVRVPHAVERAVLPVARACPLGRLHCVRRGGAGDRLSRAHRTVFSVRSFVRGSRPCRRACTRGALRDPCVASAGALFFPFEHETGQGNPKTAAAIIAERKAEEGRLSPAQAAWRTDMEHCPGIEYHVWKPTDWEAIVTTLKRPAP